MIRKVTFYPLALTLHHLQILLEEPELETQVGENWRRAGKLIAQSYNENSQTIFGLVVLPNDTPSTHVLRAKHTPQVELSILPLPYSLEDE